MAKKCLPIIILTFVLFVLVSCSRPKDLKKLSPKQIANLYIKASMDGDTELLKEIIYFSPDMSEEQKNKEVELYNRENNSGAKKIVGMVGVKLTAQCEKIINDDMAEVGVVSRVSLIKEIPSFQMILKKEDGVWKYYGEKDDFSDISELTEAIKSNPDDASLYYFYGMYSLSENPYRAYSYFRKCYEIDSNNFWITEELLKEFKDFEDVDSYEKMMLNSDTPPGNKSTVFIKLGLCFAECGNYIKAKNYYEKAENAINMYPNALSIERLQKAKNELQLRMEGKYVDLLDEIEKN